MDMLCGERTSLLFLVVGPHVEDLVMPSFSIRSDSYPTQTVLERSLSEQTDVLLHLSLSQARHIKKHYPDNALLIACVDQEDLLAFLGETITLVDYVVAPDHLQVLAGIIQAEQSRRQVLNAQARLLPRFIYQDTATAILLDHTQTHILLIKRNDNGRWFPPGGHVERGEFPYQAVLREIREETGYDASFLFQPSNMGEHFDSATIPPQPYAILVENIETHLHHDFLYLCTFTEQRGEAEGETRWFSLEEVQDLPTVPADVRRVAASLQKTGSPSLVFLDDTEKALPHEKEASCQSRDGRTRTPFSHPLPAGGELSTFRVQEPTIEMVVAYQVEGEKRKDTFE